VWQDEDDNWWNVPPQASADEPDVEAAGEATAAATVEEKENLWDVPPWRQDVQPEIVSSLFF